MIQVKKKSFAQRKLTLLVCLLGALALVVAAYFIINAIIDNEEPTKPGQSGFELLEGESYYLNLPLPYNSVNSSQIFMIEVKQGEQTFQIARLSQLNGSAGQFQLGDEFIFSANGSVYIPPIAYKDSYFSYSSIYATDAHVSGATQMSKLMYVCNAVGVLYYDERIPLSDDESERKEQLSQYGFDESDPKELSFVYEVLDENGKPVYNEKGEPELESITITIGGKVITDSAYYFRLSGTIFDDIIEKIKNDDTLTEQEKAELIKKNDRNNYVYATTTPYFEYALLSLEDFIDARLTAAGIKGDGAYAPSLTPDYKQWKNTIYQYSTASNAYVSSNGKVNPDPWTLDENLEIDGDALDQIYANVSVISPIDYTAGYYSEEDLSWIENPDKPGYYIPTGLSEQGKDGYNNSDAVENLFLLKEMNDGFKYALKNLVGKSIGRYDGVGANPSPFILTEILDYIPISFTDGETEKSSVTYSYKITAIESVFGNDGEISALGTPVLGAEKIKVSYTYKLDGEENKLDKDTEEHLCHAIIDLSSELIPADARSALEMASVGALAAGDEVVFDIVYTKDNAIKSTTKLIITDIFRVYDKDGAEIQETVAADSIVQFRYHYEKDGEMVGDVQSLTIELSKITDESSELYKSFKKVLVGKKLNIGGNVKYEVTSTDSYHQTFARFIAYRIDEIEFFSSQELIVSFKFLNSHERDPFYTESVFGNTMSKEDSEFYMYAINSNTCQNVVDILGGNKSESTTSAGYTGKETVSVDLSPESLKKYGLFANKIYFELPRGIYSPDYAGDAGSDTIIYKFYESLGFTIYISDEQYDEDGKSLFRYAASTLYGTIVKVDAQDFKFLDESFIDLWARRELFFVDIENVEQMDISLNMSDLKGDYSIAFKHDYYVYVSKDGMIYNKKDDIPAGESYKEGNVLSLGIRPIGDISGFTSSLFKDSYSSYTTTKIYGGGKEWVDFNDVYSGGLADGEFAATSNMRELIKSMFFLSYNGTVDVAEQEYVKANTEPVMSLNFKIKGTTYKYGYDFYRMDDRRVMVSIYRTDIGGVRSEETSYFYISTPSMKKIAGEFSTMLNGGTVVNDNFYPDGK